MRFLLSIALIAVFSAVIGCSNGTSGKNGSCDSLAITKAILKKVNDKSKDKSAAFKSEYNEIYQLIAKFHVPASPYVAMTDPVDRGHADSWIANYAAANPNSLQRVVFDLDKLATALYYWHTNISKADADGVSCELMIYDNNINNARYNAARQQDPRKIPGQVSIIISPWIGDARTGKYYYDATNTKTQPMNLGDLHP